MVTFERVLLGEGTLTADSAGGVRDLVARRVEEAAAFAAESPQVPEEELARHVYANPWSDDPSGDAAVRR